MVRKIEGWMQYADYPSPSFTLTLAVYNLSPVSLSDENNISLLQSWISFEQKYL